MGKGKNYFELCNDILTELFYEKIATFEELDTLPEGIKVKQDLNNALSFICNNEERAWKFREVSRFLQLVAKQGAYPLENGFIKYLRYTDMPLVLSYIEGHEYLAYAEGMPLNYWMDDGEINLYPVPSEDQNGRLIKVSLLTYDYAKDKCSVAKPLMEYETDEPIIPAHHRDILKWRVCSDWRGSVNDAKAAFYERKYKKAYAALCNDQRLTSGYPAGFDIMPSNNTAQNAIMNAFYNPRTRRII